MNSRPLAFFKGLKPRERVLLAACLLVFGYLIFELAVLRPQRLEQKALRNQIAQIHSESEVLAKTLQGVGPKPAPDAGASLRAERDRMLQAVTRAETVLGRVTGHSNGWDGLRGMTGGGSGVKLVSLRTLPSEPVVASAAAAALTASAPARAASAAINTPKPATPPLQLFRSGVELTVEGPYPALKAFIGSVETRAPHLLWGDVNLQTGQYPAATLKMTLYMLSSRPAGLLD